MNAKRIFFKAGRVVALLAAVLGVYALWARPYQLRWGATAAEVERAMPGDELHPDAFFLATRAITIEGTPEEIWPWLVQMGYGRAGFYGYDILENLGSERGLRSAGRIVPELQSFTVGDEVPISPVAGMVFYALEPPRYLIWAEDVGERPAAFTWALHRIDGDRTRLVSRIRWSPHWSDPSLLALELFTEFTDHLAVREILDGVRQRVESRVEPMARQNLEFAVYLLLLLIFLGALALVALRPLTWSRWLAGLAAGGAWLAGWYAPLPIWVAAALGLAAVLGLGRAARAPASAGADPPGPGATRQDRA